MRKHMENLEKLAGPGGCVLKIRNLLFIEPPIFSFLYFLRGRRLLRYPSFATGLYIPFKIYQTTCLKRQHNIKI